MNYVSQAGLGFWLFLFCGNFSAPADIKNPADLERAPVPQPAKLTINRGETVTITLSALTASSKEVQFILRNAPVAGKWLDAEPVRKNKAAVTLRYQSDPASTVPQEVIKFATRVLDGAVSPTEAITITLLDIKSQLELPDKLDVGQVRFGQQAEIPFFIRNVGNGNYDQSVKPPAGWSWAQGDRLQVPAGKSVEARLRFSPLVMGQTESILALGSGPKAQMVLNGYGLSPVDFPTVIVLAWNAEKARRQATIMMRNPAEKSLTIKFTGGVTQLHFPTEVALAPYAEVPLAFSFDDLPAATLRTNLEMSAGGVSQTIIVSAEAAPAQLVLEGLGAEQAADFGTVAAGELAAARQALKLTNTGGKPVTLFGNLPESFLILGLEPGMTLAPGMEVPFTIKIKPGSAGKLKDAIKWTWEQHDIQFQIFADITRGSETVVTMPAAPTVSASEAYQDPIENNDLQAIDSDIIRQRDGLLPYSMSIDPTIPRITGLHQQGAGKNTLTLAWTPAPGAGEGYEYVVLQRQIGFAKGFPRVLWLPVSGATFTKTPTETLATIGGVFPNSTNAYRIATKGPNGRYSVPSEPIEAGLPPVEATDWVKWFLLASPFLLFGLWRWWKKREAPLPRTYRSRIEGESALGEHL